MMPSATPHQLELSFSSQRIPAAIKSEGVVVAIYTDRPWAPGAFIRIMPSTLRNSQGLMGTECYPGLVNARRDLDRSIRAWHRNHGIPKTERKNQADWLQYHVFIMGGLAAAW